VHQVKLFVFSGGAFMATVVIKPGFQGRALIKIVLQPAL